LERDQFKKLLECYADGTANEEQKILIEDWYANYDDEDAMQEFSSSGRTEVVKEEMKAIILSNSRHYPFWKMQIKQYYKYAAVLALLIPAFFFGKQLFKPSVGLQQPAERFNVIQTRNGEYKKVILADRSVIQMNPETRLRIPAKFAVRTSGERVYTSRSVFLDRGEAFFEVTKDARHPFTVYTKHIQTRVLGTRFAVNTQPSAITEVSVSDGKVEVSDGKKVFDYLVPGKRLHYNFRTGKWRVRDFATREHNNWFEQVIDLDHASFEVLAEVIRVNYGVVLKGNRRFTAGYLYNLQLRSAHSLDQTMKIICSVHQNKYRRIGNEVVIY